MRTILAQVHELAAQHHAITVEEIELEVGPLSNAEPLLLESAFQRLAVERIVSKARLVIRETGLVAICEQCRQESEIVNFHFLCNACGSGNVRVVRGDCLRLLNVRLEIEDSWIAGCPA
ncbi:MAG: hydrogenase maturation nickel metallochaperone HypA [Planctomycetota bacterium]